MAGSENCSVNESKGKESPESCDKTHQKPIRFIVVIRGRNCKKYIGDCLYSLQKQTYKNWQAMVVLDAPTDGSEHVAANYNHFGSNIHLYINQEHRGLCHNMFFAIKWAACILKPNNDTVFVILDADDWLSKTALQRIERVYRKYPKTLITHGSYLKLSVSRKTKISKPYPKHGNVRKLPWRASHTKSIKWKILKNIKDEWFQHKGKWLPAASDLALMFPCIELAGLKHVKHIPQITYFWRNNTPSKTDRKIQVKCEKILRGK